MAEKQSLTEFTLSIFSDDKTPVFIGADFARELLVGVTLFALGWVLSQRSTAKHKRTAFANKILGIQRRLLDAAYPPDNDWQASGGRKIEHLQPLLHHLDFTHSMMISEGSISDREDVLLMNYRTAVHAFIDDWSHTYQRRAFYHAKFQETVDCLQLVLRAISTTRRPQWLALVQVQHTRLKGFRDLPESLAQIINPPTPEPSRQ